MKEFFLNFNEQLWQALLDFSNTIMLIAPFVFGLSLLLLGLSYLISALYHLYEFHMEEKAFKKHHQRYWEKPETK